ncbi:GNAT family N-acetyltransferase [Streptomyces olivochromogenes]|uniref:GNAT family N-acetyltransferase n=1 Tax=Streptomyces olivochromogenes TaxID=1963 RepID=UPI001F206E61|nr:GNAT family N-acetyltransferase [Streptomyces olivochromogenes]MCF3128972.1 GNAT family N-acetyltransferase [Streptomyces olivochromogenes]
MLRVIDSLRARIEQYYATVPLSFADAEDFGSLRLFVRSKPGAPYYGGPSHAQPTAAGASVAAADIARVRARQCELGVPEAFEWLAEVAPGLRARIEAAGLPVAERPLMVLDPHHRFDPRPPLPDGVTLRVLTADDPALPAALALPRLAFGAGGTAVGSGGREELSLVAEELTEDGAVESVRPTIRAGHKTLMAALAPDGTPLAVGHYHPAGGATEIGGIGTLPIARRQGLGATLTAAPADHARDHGVSTVFLAYAEDAVARIYARLGFRPAGTTLLIANQPARS